MKLHVFNPEHDIALAHNDKYFTAPRAGRQLRKECGFLPALWADDGDYVLVDDVIKANRALIPFKGKGNIHFITLADLHSLPENIEIEPWGWDSALCFQLLKGGVGRQDLPSDQQLDDIRKLSNRRFSSYILKELVAYLNGKCNIVGEARYVTSLEELKCDLSAHERSVIKEPWSSSGRGVRYVDGNLDQQTSNWVRKVISRQGGIMVEPFYDKVLDFGMEFVSDQLGVHYRGLSIFMTDNGFYEGNLITAESQKQQIISEYTSLDTLYTIRCAIEEFLTRELTCKYNGPLGVDMMITSGQRIHPMVEINLRRTMGHVAIDLHKVINICSTMQIAYNEGHYHFVIDKSDSLNFHHNV